MTSSRINCDEDRQLSDAAFDNIAFSDRNFNAKQSFKPSIFLPLLEGIGIVNFTILLFAIITIDLQKKIYFFRLNVF